MLEPACNCDKSAAAGSQAIQARLHLFDKSNTGLRVSSRRLDADNDPPRFWHAAMHQLVPNLVNIGMRPLQAACRGQPADKVPQQPRQLLVEVDCRPNRGVSTPVWRRARLGPCCWDDPHSACHVPCWVGWLRRLQRGASRRPAHRQRLSTGCKVREAVSGAGKQGPACTNAHRLVHAGCWQAERRCVMCTAGGRLTMHQGLP